jgi:hypothetical protein
MSFGSGLLFDAQLIPIGAGVVSSLPGGISGRGPVTFKIASDENCVISVKYANGDPTAPGASWFLSQNLVSIPVTANVPIVLTDAVNAGWTKIDVDQQGAVTPTITASFETVEQDQSLGSSGYSGYSGGGGGSGYGVSGYSGYTGKSGYSGYGQSGYSGYSGDNPGSSGYSGYCGESGYSGYCGDSGYSGYCGDSGYSGYCGDSGYSGYSGDATSGYSGYQGESGYSGYSGDNPGSSGYSGYCGESGYSGYCGDSGYSGYCGQSGYSGYSGQSVSGYSGYSGNPGFSGYDGGVATLSGGNAVVYNSNITANTRILLTIQSLGTVTVPKPIGVTARSVGASFTISSADNTDTSKVFWEIKELP